MGWPVPHLPEEQQTKPISAWLIVGLCAFCLFVGVILTLLLWPSASGTARDPRFWACLFGFPAAASIALIALAFHLHSMETFYSGLWSVARRAIDVAWCRWARESLAIAAFVTVTPEVELAERIAGLSGDAPRNKNKVLKLEDVKADFKSSRTEVALSHMVKDLKPRLDILGSRQTLRVLVWTGGGTEPTGLVEAVKALWKEYSILPHGQIEFVSELVLSGVERYVRQQRSPLLLLCAQLQDTGEDTQQFTEAAVGLLFEPVNIVRRSDVAPVRLYRSMPAAIESLGADLRQLGKVGAIELPRLRMGWGCGLGNAEKYALMQAITDCGLALKGGANGLISLDDCIGPAGPISPWVSLALIAELAQYGQGAQLFALQDGGKLRLGVAALGDATPSLEPGGAASRQLGAASILVCLAPWVALLTTVVMRPAKTFAWVMTGIGIAGALALVLLLLHPLSVRARVDRDIEEAGGRLPTETTES